MNFKRKVLVDLALACCSIGVSSSDPVSIQDGCEHILPTRYIDIDWRCEDIPSFCSDVRDHWRLHGSVLPLVAPDGYTGNLSSLWTQLAKSQRTGMISLGVIGNSITEGRGCSGTWPRRLAALLEQSSVIKKVRLNIQAGGGASTRGQLLRVASMKQSDIVIVDLSMGDGNLMGAGRYSYETAAMVKALRQLPHRPFVLYNEIVPWPAFSATVNLLYQPGSDRKKRGHPIPDPCKLDVKIFGHWVALQDLSVPLVSYVDVACRSLNRTGNFIENRGSSGVQNFSFGKKYWDMPIRARWWVPAHGTSGPQHPGCDTHEVIAHAWAEFLLEGVRTACHQRVDLLSRKPAESVASLPMKCLLSFATTLDSTEPAKPYAAIKHVKKRSPALPQFAGTGPDSFPAIVEDASWSYAEDVPNKPGWISRVNSTGRIIFTLQTDIGKVAIEYLQTYTDVGTAVCWLGMGAMYTLDARIDQRVSVSTVGIISSDVKEGLQTQNLTCRTDGQKFKILSVKSC